MKQTNLLFLFAILFFACSAPKSEQKETAAAPAVTPVEVKDDAVVIDEQASEDSLKGSLRAKAEGVIGSTNFTIRYHSPALRGRIVWGGLVPLDRVWVTGAHMATSIEIDQNVSIAGNPVPAGKYGFFTIPGKDSWTLILNTNWEQHLTDEYDEKLDVLRVNVKPGMQSTNQERLRYVIEAKSETEGELVMYWEKVKVSLPVVVLK